MGKGMTSVPKSRFYHKFFEGYTETVVLDDKGRRKIERVYTGTYYTQEVSDAERKRIKVRSISLATVYTAFIFIASTKAAICNQFKVISAFNAVQYVLMLWLVSSAIAYVSSPKYMTAWEYSASSLSFRESTFLSGCVTTGSLIPGLIYTILYIEVAEFIDWIVLLVYAVSGAIVWIAYLKERTIVYNMSASEDVSDAGGLKIERVE